MHFWRYNFKSRRVQQQLGVVVALMKNKVVYLVLNPSLGYTEFQRAFEITPRSLNPLVLQCNYNCN